VEGVVGENGALVFYLDEGRMKRLFHPSVAGDEVREKLNRIEQAVLAEVPGSRVAKDQFCRMFDLAIDFCEEEPRLGIQEARKIQKICESYGAEAKVSSIHVNTWYGSYSKLDMTLLYMKTRWGVDESTAGEKSVFCGDSPNDEPMFSWFPNSIGVANVLPFLSIMESPPRYVTAARGGKGFCEIAEVLIKLKE
jgi:hydroxymethylpyrimidine pyrophosphatase-like HAD family hydrolase